MKTVFFALFILFVFNTKLPSAAAQFVQDTDGNPIRNGGSYYILPVLRGHGGGLGLARVGNETCSLTVAQDNNEVSNGLAVRISSPARILYIYEGLILWPSFDAVPTCANTPATWTIVEELPVGWSVKITGYDNTVAGWFKIEKYLDDYKLVFCSKTAISCSDLGIYQDESEIRRLVIVTDKLHLVSCSRMLTPPLYDEL